MKSTSVKIDVPAPILKKLRTLHQLAEDLHAGKNFDITRLTILKSLSVRQMTMYLKKPTGDGEKSLSGLFSEIRGEQDRYEHQRWGPVRIIESRELLVVETALECVLRPAQSALFGYDMARQFAERYNPRYGTGLIPESAPLVEEIAAFWGSHVLGKGWRKRLAE